MRLSYSPHHSRGPGSTQAWHSSGGSSLVPASAVTDVPSFTSKELSCYPGGISRAVTQKSFCQEEI